MAGTMASSSAAEARLLPAEGGAAGAAVVVQRALRCIRDEGFDELFAQLEALC
jgi:hypothetical protein